MKKVLAILAVAVLIIGVAFSLKGCGGFGWSKGSGTGKSDGEVKEEQQVEDKEEKEDTQQTENSEDQKLPDEIVVTITEEKVTVNDKVIADQDELKSYIESMNDDSKTYQLVQNNAILATYNWVTDVFQELQISLEETN